MLIVALIGFTDAAYLAAEHFRGVIPPCSLTNGCESVLTSPYAVILGVPVAVWGALYYIVMLVCIFAYLESGNERMFKFSLWFSILGFVASLTLVGIQAFIIGSYCAYCLLSAATSTVLFVTAMEVLRSYRAGVTQNS